MSNPLEYRWSMRKLLVSMNQWIADGTEPPPSTLPRISDGTLIARDKLTFPKIPNVSVPAAHQTAKRADYGPDFVKKGIVTIEPPKLSSTFPALIPQADPDGNDIRHPHARASRTFGDVHRLEFVQRPVRPNECHGHHDRLFHPVRPHARRTRTHGRSAVFHRRTVQEQGGLPRPHHEIGQ